MEVTSCSHGKAIQGILIKHHSKYSSSKPEQGKTRQKQTKKPNTFISSESIVMWQFDVSQSASACS